MAPVGAALMFLAFVILRAIVQFFGLPESVMGLVFFVFLILIVQIAYWIDRLRWPVYSALRRLWSG
jgi:hypothetical protein